jgi:phosphoribosylformimino-5-aminoimidazole carboxamide ribotide isomerase
MRVIPSIDLLDGRVVRLAQGDFDRATDYGGDPVAVATAFRDAGADLLHLVDLDGARAGRPVHLDLIRRIVAVAGLRVQVGGGLRDRAAVDRVLALGVLRVVIGSRAVTDPATVADWLGDLGVERIVLALDLRLRDGVARLATDGWRFDADRDLAGLLDAYAEFAGARLLCTDIDRDGMMTGPNLELYRALARLAPTARVQASGGIGCLDDVAALRASGLVEGVIVGRALHGGAFSLAEALA